MIRRSGRPGRRRGDRGFALVWISMLMVVLVIMAGFVVDVGNWYLNASRAQNAADAAALAGAVFMPGDLPGAQTEAIALAAGHGYAASEVRVEAGARSNQLRVTITRDVDNFFAGIIGLEATSITRDAIAEFEGPVPMGSPEAFLGDDPEIGNSPDFWLNVASQRNSTGNGDRFHAGLCRPNSGCQSAVGGVTNASYSRDGYFFVIDVTAPQAGRDLVVQAFDPGFYEVGDTCGSGNLNTIYGATTNVTALANALRTAVGAYPADVPAGWYTGAESRYQRTASDWCSGDWRAGATVGGGGPVNTTYIVRAPDETVWSDADNPVISTGTCAPRQFPGRDLAWMEANGGIWGKLTPSLGGTEWQATFPSGTWRPTLANSFRRWVTLCTIPAASVQTGQYLLQVRTNAAMGSPLVEAAVDTWGHNRFSLRAGFGTPGSSGFNTGVRMYANGRLPIYANTTGTDTTFHLARVLPGSDNRTLALTLWDISDGGSGGSMRILPPPDSGLTQFSGCTFAKVGGTWSTNGSNCSISFSAGALNEAMVTVSVPIPDDYDCDEGVATGCWVTVYAPFSGPVNDTTTWSAEMNGDPVRLVE